MDVEEVGRWQKLVNALRARRLIARLRDLVPLAIMSVASFLGVSFLPAIGISIVGGRSR